MDDRTALIALSRLKGINRIAKKAIVDKLDDLSRLFEGPSAFYGEKFRKIAISFDGWKALDADLARFDLMKVRVITLRDREYPSALRDIPDAPVVLYAKGPLAMNGNTLAIVGSRKATIEGVNLAEKIGETLSSVGIITVSGLARGIDAAAHRGALKGEGGTIAVLGCGIDVCYPSENRRLFETIGAKGLLLSEYAPGEKPLAYHFPERNRIIAGLSKGILVIEASRQSGSLITARLGLEYGREVMAVPGSVFRDEHMGANSLIKQGAKLIDNIEDVLSACFPGYAVKPKEPPVMRPEEEKILSIIRHEKIHTDEIIEQSGMEAKEVVAVLTRLEMKEIIREVSGGYYLRK